MVKAIIAFVLISFTTTTASAQEIEFDVLYASDQSELTENYKSLILEKIPSDSSLNLIRVELTGHTDSDASDEYNLKLSKSRVEGVAKYLIEAGISSDLIHSSFKGESDPKASNSTNDGKQANRRVHIKFILKTVPQKICDDEPVEVNTCYEDTTIYLPRGGMYQINKCTYLKNPDCVKIKEITSAESLADAGLNTMSEDGEPLISAGMVDYDICKGVEVKFYLPIRETCDADGMTLWQLNANGVWEETSKEELEPVEVNGQQYYQIRLAGRGVKNSDKRPNNPPKPKYRKSRFTIKANTGLTLQAVTLYCDCPLQAVKLKSKKNKGQKVVYRHLKGRCCPSMRVMVEATDASGDSLVLSQRLLTELDGNTCLGNCPTTVRKKFLFIRTRNKALHRKYKLRRNDFK